MTIKRREKEKGEKADKPKILRWKGLLQDQGKQPRLLVFVVLCIFIASLTFTQLGLIGVGVAGEYSTYTFALLAPMALGALLLGVPYGTLLGLVSGGIMLLHATMQPLDYYEIDYVTPFSSIVLFTLTAFFMSLMLAIALRKNPPLWRQILRMAIIFVVVSIVFSSVFFINVIMEMILDYADLYVKAGIQPDSSELQVQVFYVASQLGDTNAQIVGDFILMFGVCVMGMFVTRKILRTKDDWRLLTKFRLSLLAVVFLAFAITAAGSFIIITEQAKATAETNMNSEIDYLAKQLTRQDERVNGLNTFLAADAQSSKAIDEQETKNLEGLFSIDSLLDGYTKEKDGTIVVFKDDKVLLADDPNYEVGDTLEMHLGLPTREMALKMMDGKGMRQIVYNDERADTVAAISSAVKDEDNNAARDRFRESMEKTPSTQVAFMSLRQVGDYTIMIIQPGKDVFANRTEVMIWTSLYTIVLLIAVFLCASLMIGKTIVKRIDETNGVLAEITDGNLNARVDIKDTREFKSLSAGINTTVNALKNWISEAEKRMDQELATAKAIQESALPQTFPPYPDIHDFDIYASMKAAREVGGDFYDFFLIGDDSDSSGGKLGFVIADVSGKGVPAALFMMTAKTQIRNYLNSGMEPGEAVENANRQLCDGNEAGMFVTVFAGVLDYKSGHVVYVNAGHNPPLLWQNGSWRWMKDISGMPLGLFDGFPYDQFEVDLAIGDEFLLYTDGVTEAMNVDGELYGEDRLEALVNENFYLHPHLLIQTIRHSLALFTEGAVQSDDITMLSLEYGVPPELTATLIAPADVDELPNVLEFVHSELDRRLCPVKAQKQLDIAIEELFVNVARYAYPEATPEKPGYARISYTYTADPPCIRVEIADKGVPYNPLAKPDAVTPDDIMEVPIGGLGILMAKNSVDKMEYDRANDENVVTLTKKW